MVQPRGALIPWDPQAANCHLDVDICWVGWWLMVEHIQDNSHHKKSKTTRFFFFASNCSANVAKFCLDPLAVAQSLDVE